MVKILYLHSLVCLLAFWNNTLSTPHLFVSACNWYFCFVPFFTACENHTVECIGPFFFQHVSALNADAESKLKRLKKSIRGGSSEDIDCLEFEDDVSYLKSLDPLKWKVSISQVLFLLCSTTFEEF